MEVYHNQYRQVHGKAKFYFYLNSDTLEEDIKWITENNIENIRLSQYDGYTLKTIEPVFRIKHVRALAIFIEGADLSALHELQELEDLVIGELNVHIDLSGLHHLKSLYLLYHKKIKGLDTLNNLERLILVKCDISLFKEGLFRSWQKLIELTLLSPKLPGDFSFLKHQKRLKELEIDHSRSTFEVGALQYLKDSLEVLRISNCKRMAGIYELLPKLQRLKSFTLTDSLVLNDSRFADMMPNLEILAVLGSSYFENGDIKNLERLKHVGIDDKKHYNLKSKLGS
jgi:hypothetical protein